MSEPFQKAPLMPETRSSATDQEMSQTTLNKGQRQMDSVLKSWGFRTSRDPFQENSSQAIEANKGQKTTPLREVVCSGTPLEKEPPRVCPLEREELLRSLAVSAGAFASLQLQPHRLLKRCQLRRRLIQGSFSTCLSRNDETRCLVCPVKCHVNKEVDTRNVEIQNGLASNDSEPSHHSKVIRFFDVLTARVQEKKS